MGGVQEAPIEHLGLPDEFRLESNGIYRRVGKGNDASWRWLCSPLQVLGQTRDGTGVSWGVYVRVVDPDGQSHQRAFPARLFAGDGAEVRAALLDLGLQLAPGRDSREALMRLLGGWRPPERIRTTERLGWSDPACRAFVLGNGEVIGEGPVVFQSEATIPAAAAMRAGGRLTGWRSEVSALCPHNALMLVTVSAAFAGPLLEPLGVNGGGLHLRGASSCGKTTTLRAAASVFHGRAEGPHLRHPDRLPGRR